ncbi:MAG TPA: recombination mediator RecR, partial [Stellaceae bacterium]|nr:recombination mediator RecR [Stellaceae bacterium]
MAAAPEIERLIQLLAKLPGLGPRSARRVALHLLKKREGLMRPLAQALEDVADGTVACEVCGNLDVQTPCGICRDGARDPATICVVADVADLWALERSAAFRGRYHVLGGLLSALDGVMPEDLNIKSLTRRLDDGIAEVILALNATVEGQATAHYLGDVLAGLPNVAGLKVTRLAHGVPVGG